MTHRRRSICTLLLLALPFRALPAAATVYLMGLDGAGWNVAERLLADGRMPNLASIVKSGAKGTLRAKSALLTSPIIWTSVATGKAASRHGILGFRKPDRTRYTSQDRSAAALWEILTERKRSVLSVGYLKTWPVEQVNGIMVPFEYFLPTATGTVVYPPDAELAVPRGFQFGNYNVAAAELARMSDIADFDPRRKVLSDRPELVDYVVSDEAIKVISRDEGFTAIANAELKKRRYDLVLLYISGIDLASHATWGQYEQRLSSPTVSVFWGDFIPRYYELCDRLVGEALSRARPDDTVIIVADHGFARGPSLERGRYAGEHRPEGVFAARGPAIRRNVVLRKDLDEYSIAPTILYLLGLPVAKDMDGRVIEELLDPRYARSHPVTYVETYERRRSAPEGQPSLPFSPDELKVMKLSGYIE